MDLGKLIIPYYFYAQFSKPLKEYGVWSADIPDDWSRKLEDVTSERYQEVVANAIVNENVTREKGKHLGFYTNFPTDENEQVIIKVGISFVGMEGAKQNLEQEIRDWDFDQVRNQAYDEWNKCASENIG